MTHGLKSEQFHGFDGHPPTQLGGLMCLAHFLHTGLIAVMLLSTLCSKLCCHVTCMNFQQGRSQLVITTIVHKLAPALWPCMLAGRCLGDMR